MANIRPKTLSFQKEGNTYSLRGITTEEETKIANAITAHQDISGKVDKVEGKGLSTNDYTTAEKNKLAGIAEGATANAGTITGITMNGASKGTSGVVDLGTVITAHQDISGKLNTSLKGAANGLAELDSSGKVPSSQLPSYVDDVLEYNSLPNFPSTGEAGKIYVAKDTNKTYRWTGTTYTEISESLALGETSSTAYRGDRGKTAYDHATAKGSAFSSGMYKITTNSEGHVTAATAVEKSDITGLGIPGQDTTYSNATTSEAGLMSASDKTKLDGIAEGATANTGTITGITMNGASKGTSGVVDLGTVITAHQDISGKLDTSLKGAANGLAELDSTGKVPSSQLPNISDCLPSEGSVIVQSGTTATQAIPAHSFVQWNGGLYEADDDIDIGDALVNKLGPVAPYGVLNDLKGRFSNYVLKSQGSGNAGKVLGIDSNGTVTPVEAGTGSDFIGATASTAGVHGLVPAPAAGDQMKVLMGNGTWDYSPGAKVYPVELTITNTSGAYSQVFNDSNVTADMKALEVEVSDTRVFGDVLDITPGNGTITVSGNSVSGTATVKISFIKVVQNSVYIHSDEYNELDSAIDSINDAKGAANGIATLDASGKVPSSQLPSNVVEHTTTVTATTLELLKTNLFEAVDSVNGSDMIAVRISPGFSSDGFTSGSTYGGYAYNIYKSNGTTYYFSCILSNNLAEDMFISYNNGTWKINSLTSKLVKDYGSKTVAQLESELVTIGNSLGVGGFAHFTVAISAESSPFAAVSYIGFIEKVTSNRFAVTLSRNVINQTICGRYNGAWSWDEYALNSEIETEDLGTLANQSALETALASLGGSMSNMQFKNIRFAFSAAPSSGVFNGKTGYYIGTIKRANSGIYAVDVQNSGTGSQKGEHITGTYNGSAWTWMDLNDNKQDKIQVGSFTGTTSANGNVQISPQLSNAVKILSAWTGKSDTIVLPFAPGSTGEQGSTGWWFHCMTVLSAHGVVANTELTIYYTYI